MGEKAGEFTVDAHFAGKPPEVRKVYERLLALLAKIGPVSEDPKKTSIHLVRESALAGVEVRRDYLLLNLKTDYPIEGPRVERAEKLSANRYHTKVKLSAIAEVDAEVKRWLKDAYSLSG
ncbi:MAG TPA: DUF5655 domain-containing protein [Thermoanaerobaculia bacterium]|nr:DUF5655 domain-containing protein [Thermoanaerobaculia bacterium]